MLIDAAKVPSWLNIAVILREGCATLEKQSGTQCHSHVVDELWKSIIDLGHSARSTNIPSTALTLLALRSIVERTQPPLWDELQSRESAEQYHLVRSLIRTHLNRAYPNHLAISEDPLPNDVPPPVVADVVSLISDSRIGEKPHASVTIADLYQFILEQTTQNTQPDFLGPPPPASVRRLIAELLRPRQGSVFDPCTRSGQLLFELDAYQQATAGINGRLDLYGQENDRVRWRQAQEQALVRNTTIDLGIGPLDDAFVPYLDDGNGPGGWWFLRELHPGLRCDFSISYPPANFMDSGLEYVMLDPRWEFGSAIPNPAYFAWLQIAIHHLRPGGVAAVVLSPESLSTVDEEQAFIRRSLVRSGALRCIIHLPSGPEIVNHHPTALWLCQRPHTDVALLKTAAPPNQQVLLVDLSGIAHPSAGVSDSFEKSLFQDTADFYQRWNLSECASPPPELAGISVILPICELLDERTILSPSFWLQ
ncbi:N-6 DNA Methylase [Corynebacterium testudinoris]|uniref:N-6 DNA Methylase n=1 Tax=Corynebacterium testudinoris TaxID=136857 RepID=A0A0G3H8X1_9CORY|nr:N-6 DNA Methylase [Corynebacterium testudinoris]